MIDIDLYQLGYFIGQVMLTCGLSMLAAQTVNRFDPRYLDKPISSYIIDD